MNQNEPENGSWVTPHSEKDQNEYGIDEDAPEVGSGPPSDESIKSVRHKEQTGHFLTLCSQEKSPAPAATIGKKGGQAGQKMRRKCMGFMDKSDEPLPRLGGGRSLPPLLEDPAAYVVSFEGPNDPINPINWSVHKKVFISCILAFTTFTVAFSSALFSTAIKALSAEFSVSGEVGILGVSFYVLGFATGPLFWAPLSELKGRRMPIVVSMFGFTIFQVCVAIAPDLQTVLICRFFGGLFGASPMTIGAAIFADMFDNRTRGLAMTVFSMNVLTAPLLAPFVGGFITESYLGWRWTAWLVAIMGSVSFLLDLFFLEETYASSILTTKAEILRRRTQNWAIHSELEEVVVDFKELVTINFNRPMRLLFTEPLILLLSIYMAFIYGLLYLFLTAYPLIFQGVYKMSPGIGGLPYLAMVLGMFLAGFYIILLQPGYQRKLAANNGVVIPEWRLPPAIVGGFAFAIGVFWLGWAGYKPETHWIAPTLSGVFTGFGLLAIFLQALNYLVDTYLMYAASANAGSSVLRSLCGAGFPLFAKTMFVRLGINWAATLLGGVAAFAIPIPILFYFYGHRLRARSTYALTTHDDAVVSETESSRTVGAVPI